MVESYQAGIIAHQIVPPLTALKTRLTNNQTHQESQRWYAGYAYTDI